MLDLTTEFVQVGNETNIGILQQENDNYVLKKSIKNNLTYAATVIESVSGRQMELFTSEPGLQFYGGNFLDGSIKGKYSKIYGYRSAFCLEPQHYPDIPNQKEFPTTVLHKGEEYHSKNLFRFQSIKD